MNFFIGVVPPQEISHKISAIQNRFGNNRLEPHITLRPPIALVDEMQWLKAIDDVAKKFDPFVVHLTNTGNFGKGVLFIEAVSPQMIVLQQHLIKSTQPFEQTPKQPERKHFHPHLTLGRTWCGFSQKDFREMRLLAEEYLKTDVWFTAEFLRVYYKPKSNEGYKTFRDILLAKP